VSGDLNQTDYYFTSIGEGEGSARIWTQGGRGQQAEVHGGAAEGWGAGNWSTDGHQPWGQPGWHDLRQAEDDPRLIHPAWCLAHALIQY